METRNARFLTLVILFTAAVAPAAAAQRPVINSQLTEQGVVGTPYSYRITATNSPTSFNAKELPDGLSVNTSTGLISGTPVANGTFKVDLTATNGAGSGKATLTLTIVLAAPVITSATRTSGTEGSAFSYQIRASNRPASYGASGLPAGLSVNTYTGLISGTPTVGGTWSVTLSASNNTGTGTENLSLIVASNGSANSSPAPVITSSTAASGTVGSAFSFQINASNSPASYGATGLPAGLSVNTSTGLISGTPASPGTSTVTLSATNSGGTGSATLTLTVAAAAPVISSATAAKGTVGSSFSYQIKASNSPTSYAASAVPFGLSFNTASGLLSGTPNTSGTASLTLSATNSGGTGNITLTLTIAAVAPVITSAAAAQGAMGSAFSYQITATNTPTSYAAAGLPAGLSVSTSTGAISGTPTAAGTSTISLNATNSGGTGSATLTLTIALIPPAITSGTTASSPAGDSFTYQIAATNSPTSYGATGLPAGLSINTSTGVISGTPTAGGTTGVTLSATNSGGTGSATLSITVTHWVMLTWVASTSQNIAGYNVYRGTIATGPFTEIGTGTVNGTTYDDMSVVAGQTYYYAVASVDISGNQSAYSTAVTATIPTP